MSETLKRIEDKVREATNLNQSAAALVNGVADALDELQQDPVAIKRLAIELRDSSGDLGATIASKVASTPPPVTPTRQPPARR